MQNTASSGRCNWLWSCSSSMRRGRERIPSAQRRPLDSFRPSVNACTLKGRQYARKRGTGNFRYPLLVICNMLLMRETNLLCRIRHCLGSLGLSGCLRRIPLFSCPNLRLCGATYPYRVWRGGALRRSGRTTQVQCCGSVISASVVFPSKKQFVSQRYV